MHLLYNQYRLNQVMNHHLWSQDTWFDLKRTRALYATESPIYIIVET